MSERIKGITLTVGGDTTGLRKELSNVNKETAAIQRELREVERALKLDPTNTELLQQKQKLLADSIEATKEKLNEMKAAKEKADKAIQEGTEISEKQYRLLQREIVKTESELETLKTQSKKTNDTLSDVEKPKKALNDLKTTAGIVAKGLGVLVGAGAAVAGMFSEIEENTREYRTDLSKLKTNADAAGISFKSVSKNLKSVVSITDEADSSIEALSNLLRTNISEGGLNKIVKELSGAVIAFPDTLKIESLADGLQETLATGEATGQFAELLERCGMNLDDFNAGLEASKKLGEEEQYILDTLAKTGMAEINASYVESNANLIKIKESQQEWNDTMARMGELIAPVKAEITSAFAEWINGRVDFVTGISNTKSETTELIDKIYSENTAWKETLATQKEKTEANVAEIDYTTRLYDELQTLVDSNGKVKEGNEKRVSYILNELSEAIGIELDLTGDQIKGYKDLSDSIDTMLAKKRAEIILAGQEETYKKAISEINAKEVEQAEVSLQIIEKEMELDKLRASQKDVANRANDEYNKNLAISMKNTEAELEKLQTAYKNNDAVINEYYEAIGTYEENYEALLSGNAEKIKKINNSVGESFKIAGEATEEELEKQVAMTALKYVDIQRKVEEGVEKVTQEMADEALIQYNQAVVEYEKIGKAIPDGMQVGIEDGKPTLKTKIGNFLTTVKSWFTSKEGFDTHSPSKWSGEIGKWIDEGLANEIFNNIKLVQASFKELFSAVEEEHEDLTKEEEKYNAELERIRAEGTEKENNAYLDRLKTLADEAKEKRKLIRDTYEGMVEDVQKSIETLEKDMQSYQKGLSNVDLTETKDETVMFFNDEEIKQTVTRLTDLSEKKKELEQFLENIINLRDIGIDERMLEQIKALGGEKGGLLAQALLDATPEQREQFLEDFEAIGRLSGQVTAEVYKEEMQGVADSTKALFEELNPDFLKIGEDWGTVLGEGIISKLNSALQSIKNIMNSIDFNYSIPTASVGLGLGGANTTVYKTEINQHIEGYKPQSAYEIATETRRTMENLTSQAVLS